MTGEGIAAIIVAGTGAVTSIGTMVLQFLNGRVSRDTNNKITEVHEQTKAIAENTGTHKIIDGG